VLTGSVCSSLLQLSKMLLTASRPKKEKYLQGYPGDSEQTSAHGQRETDTSAKVRSSCEKCNYTFGDSHYFCANCGHKKCDNCPRQQIQKVSRPLDADAVKSVEERMKKLDVSPQASAA